MSRIGREPITVPAGVTVTVANGTVVTVKAGDVTHTLPGEGHGITNLKDEPLEMMALSLFEKQNTE